LVDDRSLETAFAVIDTSSWLPGRRVLVPPSYLKSIDAEGVQVDLTQEAIKAQPDLASHLPVAMEGSAKMYSSYIWSSYPWGGVIGVPVTTELPLRSADRSDEAVVPNPDNHLRSLVEMKGYFIQATDGEIGHVEGYVLDSEDWNMRNLVVDTRNWLPGKKVVIPTEKFNDVSWPNRRVSLSMAKSEIESAPTRDDALGMPEPPSGGAFAFLRGMT
jgi:hypothetical protein